MSEEDTTGGIVGTPPGNTGNATGNSTSTGNMPAKVGEIGDRLSGGAAAEQGGKEGEPRPQEALPFDMSKLSLDQLQALKAALATVPERVSSKLKNPVTLLREFNGEVVIDFSNSYMAVVRNIENQRDEETPMIRVKTSKNPDWVQMRYKDFMLLPQIKCEIVKHLQEKGRVVEGEVWSKERASYVELEVTTMRHTFVVQLPTGEQLEIDSKLSNA